MTFNTLLTSVPPPRPESSGSDAASVRVRLIRESFAVVEPRIEEVAKFFYGMLFSIAPATRKLFPVNMEVQHSRLLRALVYVVQMVDRPDDLVPFLRQLGRDHRKFGVLATHYDAFGSALIGTMKHFTGIVWTPSVEKAWTDAFDLISKTMQEAAETDRSPTSWSGRVIEHQRLTWDLAVVRVKPDKLVPYRAGQYVSIEIPQRPRMWRYLSPATAPRSDGLLEFHVRAVRGGWVSRSIVGHSQVGDSWRIGSPMGRMSVDRNADRNVVMIAGGTGVAPMRAVLEELTRWGENPDVRLFVGGRTRGDLYDLDTLNAMAASNPWLSVVPVLEDPTVGGAEHGTLADVVAHSGDWSAHEVLVCGSPAMIRTTVSRLLVAGTPLERIKYDPFTVD